MKDNLTKQQFFCCQACDKKVRWTFFSAIKVFEGNCQ
nr:MAG TPA: hypothetical protein [Caudoviricetes sp.]